MLITICIFIVYIVKMTIKMRNRHLYSCIKEQQAGHSSVQACVQEDQEESMVGRV